MQSSSIHKLVFLLMRLLLPCAAQAQMAVDSGILSAGSSSEQFVPETVPLRTRVDSESTGGFFEELPPFESGRVRISGETREQYESWRGREFELIPDSKNDYLLQRLYLSLEGQPVDWLRTQVEIGSSFQFGSPFEPAPIDEDPLYFQQLLVDVSLIASDKGTLSAVAGRQTFSRGSGRLVAIRNGPNVRRSFDAVRLVFDSDSWPSRGAAGSLANTTSCTGVIRDQFARCFCDRRRPVEQHQTCRLSRR